MKLIKIKLLTHHILLIQKLPNVVDKCYIYFSSRVPFFQGFSIKGAVQLVGVNTTFIVYRNLILSFFLFHAYAIFQTLFNFNHTKQDIFSSFHNKPYFRCELILLNHFITFLNNPKFCKSCYNKVKKYLIFIHLIHECI